jgi:hypothetical protein
VLAAVEFGEKLEPAAAGGSDPTGEIEQLRLQCAVSFAVE